MSTALIAEYISYAIKNGARSFSYHDVSGCTRGHTLTGATACTCRSEELGTGWVVIAEWTEGEGEDLEITDTDLIGTFKTERLAEKCLATANEMLAKAGK